MWISMCKDSVYLVQKSLFIHNKLTLDELNNLESVNNMDVLHNLLISFHKLIPSAFYLYVRLLKSFTLFPHSLLLLLLSIKLNIINKTVKKGKLN